MHCMVPDMYLHLREFTEGDGSLGWDGWCTCGSWVVAVVYSVAVEIEEVGGRGYIHQKSCSRL